MLIFLLSFYLHYDLLKSEEINSANFNESSLVYMHHQNLLQAKSLMRDLEQRYKKTTVLVVNNYENARKRDEEFVSQDSNNFLSSKTVKVDQKDLITKAPTKPPAEFLPSPQINPYDPHLGLSPILPGFHAPPSVIENSELRSGLPYPGSLLSPRYSMYPGLMMPQSLLSVNGPGRYIASFSYSPSSTSATSKRRQVLRKEPPLKYYLHHENRHELKSFSPAISPSISNLALSLKTRSRYTTPALTIDVNGSEPPSVIAQPISPDSSEFRSGLPYSGSLLNPRYSMYPGLMMPQSLLSVNGPGHYIASFSYTPSSSRATSKRRQVLRNEPPLKYYLHHENRHELKSFSPAISRTMDVNARIWLEEIAPYTGGHKTLKLSNDYTASSTTHAYANMALRENPESSTEPAKTAELHTVTYSETTPEDPNESSKTLHTVTYSETTPKDPNQSSRTLQTVTYLETTPEDPNESSRTLDTVTYSETTPKNPNKSFRTTIAGDVLNGKIHVRPPHAKSASKQQYIKFMKELNEGYMMFFFIEMCRLIAQKDRRDVRQALQHVAMIYNYKWNSGQPAWIEDPFRTIISNLLTVPPEGSGIRFLQRRSEMMSQMLQERRTVLSPEVNSIIDEAGTFYNDKDGGRLLGALKDFEDYPNTTKSSYWICDSLLEKFIVPFRRKSVSLRRQRLLDSINKSFKKRFPLILRGPQEETPTAGESPIQMQPRRRKEKHYIKNQQRKRLSKQIYTTEYNQDIDKNNPITNDQPRIRANTTKKYRAMSRRLTPAFLPLDHKPYAQRVLRRRLPRNQIRQFV